MVAVVASRGCGANAVDKRPAAEGKVTRPGVLIMDGNTLVTAGIVMVGTEIQIKELTIKGQLKC